MAERKTPADVAVRREPLDAAHVLRIRKAEPEIAAAAGAALGIDLPPEPNTVALGRSGARCLWIGPGEWLILGGAVDRAHVEEALTGARAAHLATLTDGLVAYRVRGAAARDLLAKGCTLDLHPAAFGAARCAQTALAQVFVTIERLDDDTFRLLADRSYAAHLDRWFEDALIEFSHGNHR